MIYFKPKFNLKFMREFKADVRELWKQENTATRNLKKSGRLDFIYMKDDRVDAIISEAKRQEGYVELRERVAKNVLRAMSLARSLGVPVDLTSCPAPSIGGYTIPVNIFYAILHDTSHGGISGHMIIDAIDQTIGRLEELVKKDLRRLLNPFYWLKELVKLILRIPFLLIKATGFDVSKIEDHLFGKIFKLLELAGLVYLLIRLGLKIEAVQQLVTSLFGK